MGGGDDAWPLSAVDEVRPPSRSASRSFVGAKLIGFTESGLFSWLEPLLVLGPLFWTGAVGACDWLRNKFGVDEPFGVEEVAVVEVADGDDDDEELTPLVDEWS